MSFVCLIDVTWNLQLWFLETLCLVNNVPVSCDFYGEYMLGSV